MNKIVKIASSSLLAMTTIQVKRGILVAKPPEFPFNIRKINRLCEEGGTTTEAICIKKDEKLHLKLMPF